MIVDYEYKNGKLLVSYVDDKGNIKFKNYNWQNPTQWNITNDKDARKSNKFRTWDKKPVKLDNVRFPNKYSVYEFMQNQSDKEDFLKYTEPKITFCDIEVEITKGFPEAHLADNKVTVISLIYKNKILILDIKGVKPNWVEKIQKDINKYFEKFNTNYVVEYMYFETEKEMLSTFFNELLPKIPVLTGWNFVSYDWVYLVTRCRKLGINPDVASPTGVLVKPWNKGTDFKPSFEELPKHKVVVDYMDLFKKWDQSIKILESLKLDFVSEQVLGVKKLEYNGSLKDLQDNDHYNYLLYCCIDTALVQQIHEKQRTFDILLSMSNLANIPMLSALSPIRVTEGILFKPYYDIGIVMAKQTNSLLSTTDEDEDIIDQDDSSGGYVKYPSIGLKLWVVVFDFASLYPSIMRQFNIAPEAFKGVKISDTQCLLNGIKYDIGENDIVLLNGAVFENNDSVTKQKLTEIFADRKKHKNIALDYKKQEQLIKNYKKQRA